MSHEAPAAIPGWPFPPATPCGRPTRSGRPCRQVVYAPACSTHLTDDERAQQAAAQPAPRPVEDPACWAWPLPEREPTEDPADLLHAWQDGRCANCGSDRRRLVEDHDHTTGLVRGYLCRSCNVREGVSTEDERIARYRARNPASILGVSVLYIDPFGKDAVARQPAPLDQQPAYLLDDLFHSRTTPKDRP